MNTVVRISVAAGLAVVLAACSGASDNTAEPPAEESAAPSGTADQGAAAPTSQATVNGVANGLEPAPAAEQQETLPAVAIGKPAVNEEGLEVRVASFREVQTPAGIPGELGGPGVAFEVVVVNNGTTAVDMTNVVADLRTGAELEPALRADRAPSKRFTGTVEPGKSASAVYAFTLPEGKRDDVTLILNINAETPIVLFSGSVRS